MKLEITLPDDIIKSIARELSFELKGVIQGDKKEKDDAIFDIDGLSKYLGVTNQWCYDAVSKKSVPYFKVGRYNRFKKAAIDKWIEAQGVPVVPPQRLRMVR